MRSEQSQGDISMKRRSPAAPLLLPIVTFGIYSLVWLVKTKNEMNRTVDTIPTGWLLIVPIANIWWEWKYAVGVEQYTDKGMSRHAAFWLLFLLGPIGAAIIQNAFNNVRLIPTQVSGQPVPLVVT
jgi:hypothetical protein